MPNVNVYSSRLIIPVWYTTDDYVNFATYAAFTPGATLAQTEVDTTYAWSKDGPDKLAKITLGVSRDFSIVYQAVPTGTLGTPTRQNEVKGLLKFLDEDGRPYNVLFPGVKKTCLVTGSDWEIDTTNADISALVAAIKSECVTNYNKTIKTLTEARVVTRASGLVEVY